MPELPEVEAIRRVLETRTRSLRVVGVAINRVDVIKPIKGRRTRIRAKDRLHGLLTNGVVSEVIRHGKRLALRVEDGRVLEFGLGMSGHLGFQVAGATDEAHPHEHLRWTLANRDDQLAGTLSWKDTRRFGGVTPLPSRKELREVQWKHLGPDALEVTEQEFVTRTKMGRRAIKTRLLDQSVLAGVGNIYADEALFRSGINPCRAASRISTSRLRMLHGAIQDILVEAIRAGGSSIQTYRDPEGRSGRFQHAHAVYGRQGECCRQCGKSIRSRVLGGRTTAWCPTCQR